MSLIEKPFDKNIYEVFANILCDVADLAGSPDIKAYYMQDLPKILKAQNITDPLAILKAANHGMGLTSDSDYPDIFDPNDEFVVVTRYGDQTIKLISIPDCLFMDYMTSTIIETNAGSPERYSFRGLIEKILDSNLSEDDAEEAIRLMFYDNN